MLNEGSQTPSPQNVGFYLYKMFSKSKSIETEDAYYAFRECGRGSEKWLLMDI